MSKFLFLCGIISRNRQIKPSKLRATKLKFPWNSGKITRGITKEEPNIKRANFRPKRTTVVFLLFLLSSS